jgi:RHS repeat-associated protein
MLGEGTTALTYYQAQVKTYADYYPFGLEMEGRTANSPTYRYGFNGKEKDQAGEFSASQTHYDYGFRIYNPVWAKFLSVDPLSPSYPWYTPYQFAGDSPIAFIDLDGLEEVRPHWLDPTCNCGSYPKLARSEWYQEDTNGASGTFASAAAYNTSKLNSSVYQPISQINSYYIWAAREIDKQNANIKFFHAARDVTSLWGVGGAYYGFEWITGLSDHARKSMADVNARLLKENMPIVKELLETGKSKLFDGKKGVLWDFNYVRREQTFLTEVITKDPLSDADRAAINENFMNFEKNYIVPNHMEYTLAKSLLGVERLDYLPQKHREAIGHSLVFLKHLEGKGFEGSEDYARALLFLEQNYGYKGVIKFIMTLQENNLIKTD